MDEYKKAIDLSNDPRYGNIEVYFHISDPKQKCYKVTRKYPTSEEFEQEVQFLNDRMLIGSGSLIKLLHFQEDPDSNEIECWFEYTDNTVQINKL